MGNKFGEFCNDSTTLAGDLVAGRPISKTISLGKTGTIRRGESSAQIILKPCEWSNVGTSSSPILFLLGTICATLICKPTNTNRSTQSENSELRKQNQSGENDWPNIQGSIKGRKSKTYTYRNSIRCFPTCPRLIVANTPNNIHNATQRYKMVALCALCWRYLMRTSRKGPGHACTHIQSGDPNLLMVGS